MVLSLYILALLLPACLGHVCLFEPLQRGGVEGSEVHDASVCGINMEQRPCGDGDLVVRGESVAQWYAGDEVQFDIQVNEEHYEEDNPGNFSLYLWESSTNGTDRGEPIWSIEDEDGENLREIIGTFEVPENIEGEYTLQVIYFTNREDVYPRTNYYACSDVDILVSESSSIISLQTYISVIIGIVVCIMLCVFIIECRDRRNTRREAAEATVMLSETPDSDAYQNNLQQH